MIIQIKTAEGGYIVTDDFGKDYVFTDIVEATFKMGDLIAKEERLVPQKAPEENKT